MGSASNLCPPRDPKKKGRVEAGVKYIKRAFLPLREFRDLANANRQLHRWIIAEAGSRSHGMTCWQPLAMFAETEKDLPGPLPAVPVQFAVSERCEGNSGNPAYVSFLPNTFHSASGIAVSAAIWARNHAQSANAMLSNPRYEFMTESTTDRAHQLGRSFLDFLGIPLCRVHNSIPSRNGVS